ncbi:hypothetical protein FB381_3570 [Nocardioides albertanoniae]|uniref:SseB protein N-terminal domain-containing protein n=1 Tax=Nocardioides albertanoniae TaxID=1175486 RepID=A0A543AAM8_9ACTN|nr:hypothetical protein [Nocardioides albertanoniae]TQL69658.1 hypothetical protein FB381_3570 [Nocardioides albertanoniae]
MIDGYRNRALEAALAAADVDAVGAALRTGQVVVPQLDEARIRVFPGDHGDRPPYEAMLFSSQEKLDAFVAKDARRRSQLRDAAGVRDFLAANLEEIAHVTFDPEGPARLRVSVTDVLKALGPKPHVDLRLPKAQEWYVVDMSDEDVRDYQLADLAAKVLPKVQRTKSEQPEWAQWMTTAKETAVEQGAAFLAYWLQRVGRRPAGLAVALDRPAPFGLVRHPMQTDMTTVGQRWVASPDRHYESRLVYSFPRRELIDLALPTVDLVVATLSWGEES